jgi:hypothetical protein
MLEQHQFSRQVERIVESHALHGSESLRKLLSYLSKHALDHPGVPLKEYQIATDVFGRPEDFDPQLDSTVRVQAGRLRSKLAEYYTSEGAEDSIVVELPKGAYVVSFHHRPLAPPSLRLASEAQQAQRQRSIRDARLAIAALSLLSALLLAIIVVLATRKPVVTASSGPGDAAPLAFRVFWRPFLDKPENPWLIFSNAAFVGRPETGLRYFNPQRDAQGPVFDHYTGVGEVLAVHNLDNVFASLGRQISVKRGSLFSLDDAKNNDLIFVGSPSENLTLTEIAGTRHFIFERLSSGPRAGDLAVVNVHPQSGESAQFLASPAKFPLTEDYAVVALMPGLNPARSVLILAGTTTFGTQGAVEFVCRQASLEELLSRISRSKTGDVLPFEALVRVKITRGVPVDSQLIAWRQRSAD